MTEPATVSTMVAADQILAVTTYVHMVAVVRPAATSRLGLSRWAKEHLSKACLVPGPLAGPIRKAAICQQLWLTKIVPALNS